MYEELTMIIDNW